MLDGVSRTFALTIPQLPRALTRVVANAYLLCRIIDTIEDEYNLTSQQKRRFCQWFVEVVAAKQPAVGFSRELTPLLSEHTLRAEHELIQCVPRVIHITKSFDSIQRSALVSCVETMARGMAEFQDRDLRHGLASVAEMSNYCYYVAGVVGEMLTRLFCHYSAEIAAVRSTLMELSISFGQGLQMTNILKDIWDDRARGVCWLPREIFLEAGFDLDRLTPDHHSLAFRQGLRHLIGMAHDHLKNALAYTLLIPRHETGLREFCLWALGMAVLTLRKINRHLDFSQSTHVKITRRSVKSTILTSRLMRSHDSLLKLTFCLAGLGLPSSGKASTALANRTDS